MFRGILARVQVFSNRSQYSARRCMRPAHPLSYPSPSDLPMRNTAPLTGESGVTDSFPGIFEPSTSPCVFCACLVYLRGPRVYSAGLHVALRSQ